MAGKCALFNAACRSNCPHWDGDQRGCPNYTTPKKKKVKKEDRLERDESSDRY